MQKSLNLPSMLAAVGLAATVLLASLTTSCRHLTPTPVAPEQCQIVVPADAIPSENHAAKELQDGLRQIFGVDIPIVHEKTAAHVLHRAVAPDRGVAGVDWQEMKRDEMIVAKYKDNHPATTARRLYAVYELLEQYGVRRTHAVTDRLKRRNSTCRPTRALRRPFSAAMRITTRSTSIKNLQSRCAPTARLPSPSRPRSADGFVHTFDRWSSSQAL